MVGGPGVGSHWDIDGPGAAWLCLGPFSGTTDLADCHGTLNGADDDVAGKSVAGVGDTDGDGIPDLLIGGPGDEDGGGAAAGAAWLVTGATLLGR